MQNTLQDKASGPSKGRELVILSGKGGTGKTSVAGAFSQLAKNAVLCDCDVDAANLSLLLSPTSTRAHPFLASKKAHIDPGKCIDCGECFEVCRFEAILKNFRDSRPDCGSSYTVSQLLCEGCGLCFHVCPENAVVMEEVLSGHWYVSETKPGPFVHARLEPGEGNSGRLVTAVRLKAAEIERTEGKAIIITDGPPGTGCPVIAAVSGVDLALIVTEPTLSAISDLGRIIDVCSHFKVPALICINKYDIDLDNTHVIEELAANKDCAVVDRIPYDDTVPKAMVKGLAVTAYDCPASHALRRLWDSVSACLLVDG